MKRARSLSRSKSRGGFRRTRTSVERLEDRILLSAEPLVKTHAVDPEQPLAVENLTYSTQSKVDDRQRLAEIAGAATVIDLARPLAEQNTRLDWSGSTANLLQLNTTLESLILDLGDGDSQTLLSEEADGRLRLTRQVGTGIADLLFAKPTHVLGIRGEGGIDKLLLRTLNLGATDLSVEAEQIELAKGSVLSGDRNVQLVAGQDFSGGLSARASSPATLDIEASVDIAGSIEVKGDVVLTADVVVDFDQAVTLVGAFALNAVTESRVRLVDGARISAQSLSMSALTSSRWVLSANDGLVGGKLSLNLTQDTTALIEGGAVISLSPGLLSEGKAGVGLVVQAVDALDADVTLDMADGKINSLAKGTAAGQLLEGFELGWTQIDLSRSTVAGIGGTAAGTRPVMIAGRSDQAAGDVHVSATSLDGKGDADGDHPGIHGSVMSSLVGLHINNVRQDVRAFVSNAVLNVVALDVQAINETTYSANGKIARNQGSGSTEASIDGVDIKASDALRVVALDRSIYEAISAGFSADLPKISFIKVGIASASNTVNRSILSRISNSTVVADQVAVLADSSGGMSSTLESMATTGAIPASGFQMAFGGTFAWNQLTGATQALIDSSEVTAVDGDLSVQARNATTLSADTRAGTAVSNSSGVAAGGALAFNAVGWDMGNIAAAGLNSLLGTEIGVSELPLLTQAVIRASNARATGNVSVTAEDTATINAAIVNASDVLSGSASGLSVAAALILASNRVRSDTRAFVDGRMPLASAPMGTLVAVENLLVSAIDTAAINADVALSAAARSGGVAIGAGAVIARNDVRSGVNADALRVVLDTGGDLSIRSEMTATIDALLTGEVMVEQAAEDDVADPAADATGDAGADAGTSSGGTSVGGSPGGGASSSGAAGTGVTDAGSTDTGSTDNSSSAGGMSLALNGMIATNLILVDAGATVRESTVRTQGHLNVEAEDSAAIRARNSLATSSDGVAIGLVGAFNTIGWKATNLLYAAIDTVIGSSALGVAQPASAHAEISDSTIDVGQDLTLKAVTVPEIDSTVINEVSSTGYAAAGIVLASNLVNSSTDILLTPKSVSDPNRAARETVFRVGGNVAGSSSDTSGIVARVVASANSAGVAAVGAQLVRNDVRNRVDTLFDSTTLVVKGDLTIEADGSASIRAILSDQLLPDEVPDDEEIDLFASGEPAPEEGTGDPAAAGASMAFKGLIATNLVLTDVRLRVLSSDLEAGGNLTAQAVNAANIEAENSMEADAEGLAIGVTLAFNTIGWQSQNVLFNALDALLGSQIGNEQPAQVVLDVVGSSLVAGGDLTLSATAEEDIQSTITNSAASDGTGVAAGMVLASNLLSARVKTSVRPAANALGNVTLSAGGNLEISAEDAAGIRADVSVSNSSGGSAAVGGLAVRNDVRTEVLADLDRVTSTVDGDLLVLALSSGTIEALLSGRATSVAAAEEAAAEPTGGGAETGDPTQSGITQATATQGSETTAESDSTATTPPGTGEPGTTADTPATEPDGGAGSFSLAVNGLIATNLVLGQTQAKVNASDLTVNGNLAVQADNVSSISALNTAAVESEGASLGVTLAFNTIGWRSQNLLANSVNALLGDSVLGAEQPASVAAMLVATPINVGGNVRVAVGALDESGSSPMGATITAKIINDASAGDGPAAASLVLATNKISSTRRAWVGPLLPEAAATAVAVEPRLALTIGGDMEVAAVDAGTIEAAVDISAASGGGAAVGGMVVTNDLRNEVLASMDRVHLVSAGEISIAASTVGTIASTLSGNTESPAAEEGTDAGASNAGVDSAGGGGATADTTGGLTSGTTGGTAGGTPATSAGGPPQAPLAGQLEARRPA